MVDNEGKDGGETEGKDVTKVKPTLFKQMLRFNHANMSAENC